MLEPVIDKVSLAAPPDEPASRPPGKADASGALARKFVELLLEDMGKLLPAAAQESKRTSTIFDEFGLDDGTAVEDEAVPDATLSVDEASVAVLLAAAFEGDPATLRALRREAPVVVVQAPDARTVPSLEYVVRVCALGRSTGVLSNGSLDHAHAGIPAYERRQAAILLCDVDKRDRALLEPRALAALSLAVPVVALSVDIGRAVPEQVRGVADRIVMLGGWNRALLAVLIEAVTGSPAAVPDETWIASVTLDDLRMSVSRHRGAVGSLERLRSTVRRRVSKGTDLPDVAALHGYGEAKRVALEMLADLADYRDGKVPWSAMSRGLVLAGPTGVGKTHFVRCFAKSAGLPLVTASMAMWQSAGDGHLGDMLAAMRRSFAEARGAAPAILFIDEIDSVGDRETFHHRHKDYSSQVVNGLLEELDGAADRTGVTVFAATNHPGRIDSAVLRPGRLDRIVTIAMPDVPELAAILCTLLGTDLQGADLLPVALAGRGGSGASAAGWVRQARGIARRAGRTIEVADLLAAVREGRIVVPEREKRRIALHEAAHACAVLALEIGTLHGISLHDAGGTTRIEHAVRTTTREEAVAVVVHLLAGRAAEKRFLGSVSAGAGGPRTSDLARATQIAFAVEVSWGLGESGPVWLGDADADITRLSLVPGFTTPVRRLLRECESEAERLVDANRKAISRCADRLIEAGHLDADEALAALGPIPRFEPASVPTAATTDPSSG